MKFYKVIETCTIDTSDRYVKGEEEALVFKAPSYEAFVAYYDSLKDYNTTHGLDIDAYEITEWDVEILVGSVDDAIDITDFD